MAAPILGYWDMRAIAEPIRYILHYNGVKFTDKRYERYVFEPWYKEKFTLDLDFPNLPYYIDGDIRLTQSLAILRHLARKYNLDGSTDSEKRRIDLVEQQIVDLRTFLIRLFYSPTFDKEKDDFIKDAGDKMKQWSSFLGKSKFFAGDNLSFIDFIAYDTFDFYEYLAPSIYKDLPNLKEYLLRVRNLPKLQSYLKSPEYTRWPIFGPTAYFGGKGDEPKKD